MFAKDKIETFYAGETIPPGFRANHARGLLVEGTFVASPLAVNRLNIALFYPVLARKLNIPQDDPHGNPRGLAR